MRPNFLIIGAQKCGTTSLFQLLGEHPDIRMCSKKEPHFFSYDQHYERGMAWYESLYADCQGAQAAGEASPSYSVHSRWPKAAERIARDLPDIRIIYIVRHPIARLESSWMHEARMGRGVGSYERDLRMPANTHLETTRYWKQLDVYRQLIPDSRILLLFLEDLKAHPQPVLERCFTFLGVDPDAPIKSADEPRNSWRGIRDGSLLQALRRMPQFGAIRDAAPKPLRSLGRRALKRPIKERFKLSPSTRQWVWSELEGDLAALLDYAGKPRDFWTREPVEPAVERAR